MTHTVLVVDDGPDWRNMLAGLLKDMFTDITVLTASSVEEAKDLLSGHSCSLAIIDIRLDESDEKNIDGLWLLEHVRKYYPDTNAIIITGYASIETVEQALQPDKEGVRLAIDYVEKSKVTTDLLPRVKEILENNS
jgi:DNA-binding NtrC family response regulator